MSFLYFYFCLKEFLYWVWLQLKSEWMNWNMNFQHIFNTPLPLNYLKKIAVFAPSKRFYRWQWASLVIKSLRKKNLFIQLCENLFKVASKCSKLANFTRYFLHLVYNLQSAILRKYHVKSQTFKSSNTTSAWLLTHCAILL